jgi:quercetin dioxygenase-like cupin family protein
MPAIQIDNRHVQVARGEGRLLRVLSDIAEIKLTGAETGGAYALIEVRTPPQGGASVLHTHPPQETFMVLEGTYEFKGIGSDGPYAIRAKSGTVVHVAGGEPHSYQNVGETPGRILMLFEPPGRMLDFFEELHAAVDAPDPLTAPPEALPDLQRTLELFARYDLHIVSPSEEQADVTPDR